jgi:hypothetical protein
MGGLRHHEQTEVQAGKEEVSFARIEGGATTIRSRGVLVRSFMMSSGRAIGSSILALDRDSFAEDSNSLSETPAPKPADGSRGEETAGLVVGLANPASQPRIHQEAREPERRRSSS